MTAKTIGLTLLACAAAIVGLRVFLLDPVAPEPPARPASELVAAARRLDLEGDHAQAVALYRQALAQVPDSYDAHYGLARALDLDGDYATARDHFTRAVALAADDGARDQALRMLGVSWTFVGEAEAAAGPFSSVFERRRQAGERTGAAEVANELGRVFLELGDLEGAHTWYERGYTTALDAPDLPAAQIDLAELRWAHAQARIAARRGDLGAARAHMATVKTLVDKDSNPSQAIQYPYLEGYVAFFTGRDAEAISALEQADQEDPFVLTLLAQAHERSGEKEQARTYYARALESTSHAVANALARPLARSKLAAAL